MPKELVFLGPRKVGYREYADASPGPGQIKLRTLFSGISHGTEMNVYRGTSPQFRKAVRRGLFQDGEPAYQYPRTYGYEEVAEVVAVGPDVRGVQVGDRISTRYGHRETAIVSVAADEPVHRLPPAFPAEQAIFLSLGGVALDAYLSSEIRLGESAVIFGQGVVGLFVLQLCRLGGVRPIGVVDPLGERLDRARQLGAGHAFRPDDGDVAEATRRAFGSDGADVVFETSGSYRALHEAIRCGAPIFSKVMAVAWYQGGGTELLLGEEFHHSSFGRAGAPRIIANHHRLPPAPGRQWDVNRVYGTVFNLIVREQLQTSGLITHRVPFDRAAEAYELIDRHPEQVCKVVLEFGP